MDKQNEWLTDISTNNGSSYILIPKKRMKLYGITDEDLLIVSIKKATITDEGVDNGSEPVQE